MSRAALLVALALAAVLAVTAAVLLRPPSTVNVPPLAFDPAAVTSLSVTGPDASCTFARDGAGWILTSRGADGTGFAHHADPVKVQSALDALSTVPNLGESPSPDPRGATVLDLVLGTENLRVIVGANPLSGRVHVLVARGTEPPIAFLAPLPPFEPLRSVPGSVANATAFLDPAVFRWTGVPSSITIHRGSTTTRAERTGRAWHLREPLDTSADSRAFGMLQAALANLRLVEASAITAGPERDAKFTLLFVIDGPTPAEHSIRVAADGTAEVLGPLGAMRVVISDPDTSPLTPPLAALVNHHASPFPAADITAIHVNPPDDGSAPSRRFARVTDGWTGPKGPLLSTDLAAVSALASLLGDQPADAVTLDPPVQFEPVATVRVDLRVTPTPFTFALGTSVTPASAAGGQPRRVLTIVAGPITRLYRPGDDGRVLPFLAAVAHDAPAGPEPR